MFFRRMPKSHYCNRKLDAAKLIHTAGELEDWIEKHLPHAHLSTVAEDVHNLTLEAIKRANKIRQPMWWLRILLLLGFVGFLVAGYHHYRTHTQQEFMDLVQSLKPLGAFVGSAVLSLVMLEWKIKRWRAIRALHELRSVAHIIDMHQLAKDPVIERFHQAHNERGVETEPEHKLETYLHACIALLALVSKLGQLYVENLYDVATTQAANDFESTCNNLAEKIWSKLQWMKLAVISHNAREIKTNQPVPPGWARR